MIPLYLAFINDEKRIASLSLPYDVVVLWEKVLQSKTSSGTL